MITAAVAMSLMMTACSTADDTINNEVNTNNEVAASEVVENVDVESEENNEAETETETGVETGTETDSNTESETVSETETENETVEVDQVEPIDLQVVKPNELGEVMVVMYHGLGKKNSAYTRTVESFRQDLLTYYEMGFRPINLSDYVDGNVDVPAGMTPIVLTFDDGNKSNFNVIEKNEATGELSIDRDSAIGIIVEFNKQYPDWDLKGSFFLNGGTPFGQKEFVNDKVNWLVENGFEVGNHSFGHEDLTEQDAAGIQKSLGKNIQEIESRIENYTVNTLALPFGKRPKDQERYDLVTSGIYNEVPYSHKAILLVGWKPEVSVFDKGFDPLAIMRVQSGDGDFQMIHWLEDYRKNPSKRFVSDGSVNTVTVPEGIADHVNMKLIGDKELITYTLNE